MSGAIIPDFRERTSEETAVWWTRCASWPRQHHCTPAQLALAWLLAQGEDMAPIPGTKRRLYLDENLGALDVKLTAADLARIDETVPRGAAAGPRYNAELMKHVGI